MAAIGAQAWQYGVVVLAVAGSALALAGHFSPALRAWLRKPAARLLAHRRLPAFMRRLGNRLAAADAQARGQGCGPCAGCGSSVSRPSQPLMPAPRRQRRQR